MHTVVEAVAGHGPGNEVVAQLGEFGPLVEGEAVDRQDQALAHVEEVERGDRVHVDAGTGVGELGDVVRRDPAQMVLCDEVRRRLGEQSADVGVDLHRLLLGHELAVLLERFVVADEPRHGRTESEEPRQSRQGVEAQGAERGARAVMEPARQGLDTRPAPDQLRGVMVVRHHEVGAEVHPGRDVVADPAPMVSETRT